MPKNEWQKRDAETSRSFAAFNIYLRMGADRSLAKVADKLDYNSPTQLERWSSKYEWVDRADAYDQHMQEKQLTIRENTLQDYQKEVIEAETTELAVLQQMLNKKLQQMNEELDTGEEVDAMDIKRLTSSYESLNRMRRRAAQLPTSFRSESTDDEDDDTVYIISS